jgi:hypothetical protein
VPEDLSVVGFDDVEVASYVGLTTVRQPLFESGRRGAELLLQLISEGADQVVEPVVEQLPVEVRSSETMEGRARLYARGGARDHALATLRSATLARLARTLGLGRSATPEEIIGATAALTGRDPAALTALLRSEPAFDDRGFVRISDELLRLERELGRAVRPS